MRGMLRTFISKGNNNHEDKQRKEEQEQREHESKNEERIYQRYITEKNDLSTREISNDTRHAQAITHISAAAMGYLIITNSTPTLLIIITLILLGSAIAVTLISTRTANKDIAKKKQWYEEQYTKKNSTYPDTSQKWTTLTKNLNRLSTGLFIAGITAFILTYCQPQPHTTTETTTQKGTTMKTKDTRTPNTKPTNKGPNPKTPNPIEEGGTTGSDVVKPTEIPQPPKPNPQTNPSTTGNTPTPPKPKSDKK